MSNIEKLYREYFQKSKVFLYPALEIKKGISIAPIQTHIHWDGFVKKEERRLICLYHQRDDAEYKEFERTKLVGNKLFEKLISIDHEGPKGVYIFNFDEYDEDWTAFLKGRYSNLSPELKRKIKTFFKPSKTSYVYVESYLHPEKYYSLYAELLGVSTDTLKEVGELTSAPDLEKEALKIKIKSLPTIKSQ